VLPAIVRLALRFRGAVLALACAVLVWGVWGLLRAHFDVFPEFAPPEVQLQVEAPGLSPAQVEASVTRPVEAALGGIPGLEAMRSASIQGVSVITLLFADGGDIYRYRQQVAERLTSLAGRLPAGVEPPAMGALISATGDLMTVGFTSDTKSIMEVRTAVDWIVTPRLVAVPGVARVSPFGGEVRQLQVQVDPQALLRFGLSLEDVRAAAERATGVRGAGFIDTENQRLVLRTHGQSLTPGELGRVVVRQGATGSVRLADLGRVVDGAAPRISAGSVMGAPGVVVNIWSQYGANALEVTARLDQAMAELAPALAAEGVTAHPGLFRAAAFVDTAIRNVEVSLLLGAVLVVVVLFLLLYDARSAAISCSAIPLSLLAALVVLRAAGVTLNTMTLGGLAIAIGEVVDDAVIGVENILRRLRLNRQRRDPLPAFRVVLDASVEVRTPVVYATFAVMLVFLPVLTLPGLSGRFFSPLALAYILAVLASLVTALTVTPALGLMLLAGRHEDNVEPPLARWMRERYVALLGRIERRPGWALALVAVIAVAGVAALPFLGSELLPSFREGHFIVHVTAAPGTAIAESSRIGDAVTRALLELPDVRSVAQRVGRAESDDTFGPNESEMEVDMKPLAGAALRTAEERVREAASRVPGITVEVNSFLKERIEETLSGYTSPVVVKIFGPDLDALDRAAADVRTVLSATPGAVDVRVQTPPGSPQLEVRLRNEALARWGLAPVEVLEAVRIAYQGEVVGQVYLADRVFDVAVTLLPEARRVEAVAALPLRASSGVFVTLGQVAEIAESSGRNEIDHDGARRVQVVTCGVSGRDVPGFVADMQRRFAAQLRLPEAAYLEVSGAAQEQARTRRDLMLNAALAGLLILLLLGIVLHHQRNVLLVLLNLPFALVGGVLAAAATGGVLSVGGLVGFVTLFGITLRNAIMMISHYEHLVSVEGAAWGPDTALRGAAERLLPIVMTATVTGLGLLPLALGGDTPGREIEGPMAMVIVGGLITSTVLNLVVVPSLALRFGRFGVASGDRDHANHEGPMPGERQGPGRG
jgi:CzcA family heavy metal efflux pump